MVFFGMIHQKSLHNESVTSYISLYKRKQFTQCCIHIPYIPQEEKLETLWKQQPKRKKKLLTKPIWMRLFKSLCKMFHLPSEPMKIYNQHLVDCPFVTIVPSCVMEVKEPSVVRVEFASVAIIIILRICNRSNFNSALSLYN